ncbi:MAG TPA: hypothetical protein VL967_00085 [Terracidiphilus sp.]|nr:hypothetical protein [Terracidiphilus sp.]
MDSFERSLQLRILQSQLGSRRIDVSVLLDSINPPSGGGEAAFPQSTPKANPNKAAREGQAA